MTRYRTQTNWVIGEKVLAGYFQFDNHDPFSFDHIEEGKEYVMKMELVELEVVQVGQVAQHSFISPADPTNVYVLKDEEGRIWRNQPVGAMGEARGHSSFFTNGEGLPDLQLLTPMLQALSEACHRSSEHPSNHCKDRASLKRKTYFQLLVAIEEKWPNLRVVELRWGGWDDPKKYIHVLVNKDQCAPVSLDAEAVHFLKTQTFYTRPEPVQALVEVKEPETLHWSWYFGEPLLSASGTIVPMTEALKAYAIGADGHPLPAASLDLERVLELSKLENKE